MFPLKMNCQNICLNPDFREWLLSAHTIHVIDVSRIKGFCICFPRIPHSLMLQKIYNFSFHKHLFLGFCHFQKPWKYWLKMQAFWICLICNARYLRNSKLRKFVYFFLHCVHEAQEKQTTSLHCLCISWNDKKLEER